MNSSETVLPPLIKTGVADLGDNIHLAFWAFWQTWWPYQLHLPSCPLLWWHPQQPSVPSHAQQPKEGWRRSQRYLPLHCGHRLRSCSCKSHGRCSSRVGLSRPCHCPKPPPLWPRGHLPPPLLPPSVSTELEQWKKRQTYSHYSFVYKQITDFAVHFKV